MISQNNYKKPLKMAWLNCFGQSEGQRSRSLSTVLFESSYQCVPCIYIVRQKDRYTLSIHNQELLGNLSKKQGFRVKYEFEIQVDICITILYMLSSITIEVILLNGFKIPFDNVIIDWILVRALKY